MAHTPVVFLRRRRPDEAWMIVYDQADADFYTRQGHDVRPIPEPDHIKALQDLADYLASTRTDIDLDGDLSGDDAVSTLTQLVATARVLSDCRPEIDIPDHDDPERPFRIGPRPVDTGSLAASIQVEIEEDPK